MVIFNILFQFHVPRPKLGAALIPTAPRLRIGRGQQRSISVAYCPVYDAQVRIGNWNPEGSEPLAGG